MWIPGLERKESFGVSPKIPAAILGQIRFAISQTVKGYLEKKEYDIMTNDLLLSNRKIINSKPSNLAFPEQEKNVELGFGDSYNLKIEKESGEEK